MRKSRPSQTFKIQKFGGVYALQMSCREAGCEQYERGWVNILDPENDEHAQLANWFHNGSGRQFFEFRSEDALESLLRMEGGAIPGISAARSEERRVGGE